MAIRNPPRFLELQKERWQKRQLQGGGRKGGKKDSCREARQKMWQKKGVAAEIMEKANSRYGEKERTTWCKRGGEEILGKI